MIEQDKILYCFKLDEKTAKISKYEINIYEYKIFYGKEHIVYHHNLDCKYATNHDIAVDNLDKFIHFKVHTFNPKIEDAIAIINSELISKRTKAYDDYQRWDELIVHFNKNI